MPTTGGTAPNRTSDVDSGNESDPAISLVPTVAVPAVPAGAPTRVAQLDYATPRSEPPLLDRLVSTAAEWVRLRRADLAWAVGATVLVICSLGYPHRADSWVLAVAVAVLLILWEVTRAVRRAGRLAADATLLFGTVIVLALALQAITSLRDPGWPRPRWRPDALGPLRFAGAVAGALALILVVRYVRTRRERRAES